ncbi:MAG: hypothetical protein ACI4FZ_13455 [Lachnospiraceae bacterium]
MTEQIRTLFQKNIELLEITDKAILYFREQKLAEALEYMPQVSEKMRYVIDGIISDKEYFELVSTESLMEMLEGILEAGRNMDYVLLADLLELQLSTLLCNVQELIMKKEDFPAFSEELYEKQCELMAMALRKDSKQETVDALFAEPLKPQELMEEGYRVEFTSCGLMTAAVGTGNGSVYLHTNHKVSQEAFLLARSWKEKDKQIYLVHGFGLGYHIAELLCQTEAAQIEVYESNGRVLKLACAFAPIAGLLANSRLHLTYDPTGELWKKRTAVPSPEEKVCIHAPSMRAAHSGVYVEEEKQKQEREARL